MALFEAFMLLVEVIAGVRLIVSEVAELRKQFKKMIKDIENTGKHDQVQELDKKLTSIVSQVSAAHSGKRLDSQYITQQFRNSLDELEKSSELQSVRNVKKTLDMLESQGISRVGKSGHLTSSSLVNSNNKGSHNLPPINGSQLATTSSNRPYSKVQKMVVKINFNCLCVGCVEKIREILKQSDGFQRLSIQDDRHVEVVFGTSVDLVALTHNMKDKLKRTFAVVEVRGGTRRPVGPNNPNPARTHTRLAKSQGSADKSPSRQKPKRPGPKKARRPDPKRSA